MGCRLTRVSIWVVAAAAVLPGCAAKQRVALDCVPHVVEVFVDGRKLEQTPEWIELRKDRPHTVYFKGGGYRPHMVVLSSEKVNGEPRLSPEGVCTEALFVETQPEVRFDVER